MEVFMEALCHTYSHAEFDENGQFSSFSLDYPENFNFAYDVVDAIAAAEPEKRALVWCNESGEERMFTFREISILSSKAAAFLSRQGIKKGDRVLLMLKRYYDYWYIVPALHKLGAVVVPATHMLSPSDIVYRAEMANIRTIICAGEASLCEKVRAAKQETATIENLYCVHTTQEGFVQLDAEMMPEAEQFPRQMTHISEPMLTYFTSGTTGYPKAVTHNYTYPLAHIVTAKYWQCVQDNGLHLTVADTGWAKASWGKIYGQWLSGSAVMVYDYERFDGEAMMQVLEKYGVTTFCAPPTVYRMMAKSGIRPEAFQTVKHCSTAGEALQKEIIRLFHESTGLEIMEGFGQSETTLIIGNFFGGKPKRGSLGKPSPLYRVMLVDADDQPVAQGEPGEIVIDTRDRMPEGLCMGYENNAEANARYWKNGFFHTGDMAYCDEEGYYFYISRVDNIIKSSGYRIGPFEVESALIKHPAVMECAVTGVPDEERGNIIKASVVLAAGYAPSDALVKELQVFVKERTAPYKYPRIIAFVDELPKTFSGKIRYNVIREADEKK